MNPIGDGRGYGVARRTLIRALNALADLPPRSFILVGAQAVYLRAPDPIVTLPPFTLDGDLVADPLRIGRPQLILERLEANGFVLRDNRAGLYHLRTAAEEDLYASRIDILVPEGHAHRWDPAGYNMRGISATMRQDGLELTLADHSTMTLRPIEHASNQEPIDVEVAGILSLLVAKGWKIEERFGQGDEAFEQVAKDVLDVFRLLRAAGPGELRLSFEQLASDELKTLAKIGLVKVIGMCGRDKPGSGLLQNMLGATEEALIAEASLNALVRDLDELVRD
jgi:hypothetical protein